MKVLVLIASLAALALAPPAAAHRMTFHPSLAHRSLSGRAAGQRLILAHDRSVLRRTAWLDRVGPTTRHDLYWSTWQERLYHAAELRWTKRNLERTLAAIRTRSSRVGSPTGTGWISGYATWYGPGFYGSPPACGGSGLTESSWWVATIPARCGVMVTICASRCVRAPSMDTGAFPSSNLDLAPAVARALGGLYTRPVRWRFG